MKNKDGIVIKVGQEWKDSDDEKLLIVGFYKDYVVIRNSVDCSFDSENPNDETAFETLIKSHNGADLKQARKEGWKVWVDGMEKPDPKRIGEVCVYDETWIEIKDNFRYIWDKTLTYSYKLKEEVKDTPLDIQLGVVLTQVDRLNEENAKLTFENTKLEAKLDKIQSDLVLFLKGNR